MKQIGSRVWWWIDILLIRARAPFGGKDLRNTYAKLAWDAARLGHVRGFLYAIRRVGDLENAPSGFIASVALDYYELGFRGKAQGLFGRALAKDQGDALFALYYGTYLDREGQAQEALPYLERALAAMPNDSVALAYLGHAHRHLDHPEEAKRCFRLSIRFGPNQGEPYESLAHLAADAQQWEEAVECWQEALIRMPNDPQVLYNLGNALCELKQYQGAVPAFRKALRQGWAEPHRAWYGLALCYKNLGKKRRACKCCRKALDLEAGYELARTLMREIEESLRADLR